MYIILMFALCIFVVTLAYTMATTDVETKFDALVAMLTKGYGWMSNPLLWLLVVVVTAAIVLSTYRRLWLAAGADWLRCGNRWVNTYELVRVCFDNFGRGGIYNCAFEDARGRRLSIDARSLMRNREVWNLAYSGILHSLYSGRTAVDEHTRAVLQLDRYIPEDSRSHRSRSSTGWWAALGFVSLGLLTPLLTAFAALRLRSMFVAACAVLAALPVASVFIFLYFFVPDVEDFFQAPDPPGNAWFLVVCGVGQLATCVTSMYLIPLRRHVLDIPRMRAARNRFAELRGR